jgi:hypothetical protein
MKLEEFREYAKSNNVIPVYRKLLADGETPLNIYKKLAKNKAGTFYLNLQNMGESGLVTHLLGLTARLHLPKEMVLLLGLEHLQQECQLEWIHLLRCA